MNIICSFCQRDYKDVYRIVLGESGAICNACVELCSSTLLETPKEETKSIVAARFVVLTSQKAIEDFDYKVRVIDPENE